MSLSSLGFAEGMLIGLGYAKAAKKAGKAGKVFDWDKAARRIKESGCSQAEAGLGEDWDYTGGEIYANGKPVKDDYTYLASSWATPVLVLDGEDEECWVEQTPECPWNSGTKWPDSALEILNAGSQQ